MLVLRRMYVVIEGVAGGLLAMAELYGLEAVFEVSKVSEVFEA